MIDIDNMDYYYRNVSQFGHNSENTGMLYQLTTLVMITFST